MCYGLQKSNDEALADERRLFQHLMMSNLAFEFFDMR